MIVGLLLLWQHPVDLLRVSQAGGECYAQHLLLLLALLVIVSMREKLTPQEHNVRSIGVQFVRQEPGRQRMDERTKSPAKR